ncbi:MAG: hypothetical protein IPL32_13060 [Chloracidobacterium sp.]|nr:hypothetical protein [Chloracidobacterium sp.]
MFALILGVMETTTIIEKSMETKFNFAFADSPFNGERSPLAITDDFAMKKLPMQAWEYCIFEIKGIHSDQERAERVDELNKLGAAGWEPAGTTSGGSQYHEYIIFKRPDPLTASIS